jgi:hypothetical protein
MRILKIAERFEDEAEPLPEKNWLEWDVVKRHIKTMDDLWIHIVQCEADKEKGIASVFVNAVELISGRRTDCEHVKQLLERLMRERIIYREKALAAEKGN